MDERIKKIADHYGYESQREQLNKCYFCGKECGAILLTVNDKTLIQSELFRANMCSECSEAVHSALILLRTITKGGDAE